MSGLFSDGDPNKSKLFGEEGISESILFEAPEKEEVNYDLIAEKKPAGIYIPEKRELVKKKLGRPRKYPVGHKYKYKVDPEKRSKYNKDSNRRNNHMNVKIAEKIACKILGRLNVEYPSDTSCGQQLMKRRLFEWLVVLSSQM